MKHLALTAIVGLTACSTPPTFPEPWGSRDVRGNETRPVKVETAQGIVTCQLYGAQRVLWDRAIDYPADMFWRDADAYCREAGEIAKKQLGY